MTHEEIAQLRCALTAGQDPQPGTLHRVLLTVADLERELLQRAQRGAHAMAVDAAKMSDLCQRITQLEEVALQQDRLILSFEPGSAIDTETARAAVEKARRALGWAS